MAFLYRLVFNIEFSDVTGNSLVTILFLKNGRIVAGLIYIIIRYPMYNELYDVIIAIIAFL